MITHQNFLIRLKQNNIHYKNKEFKIIDDTTLLKFLYTSGNIKLLTGRAFCWPNQGQLTARVTIAFDEYEDLLKSFLRLKSSIELLE